MAISSAIKGGGCWDVGQKPMETQDKVQPGQPKKKKVLVNAVSQSPARSPLWRANLCCLGQSMCLEAHQLEKCDKFHKMSVEQRVVNVNEFRLCQICMKHLADMECYQKAQADYKGCCELRCCIDHHTLLHWALIVSYLFQVQVAPESYPSSPGSQLF